MQDISTAEPLLYAALTAAVLALLFLGLWLGALSARRRAEGDLAAAVQEAGKLREALSAAGAKLDHLEKVEQKNDELQDALHAENSKRVSLEATLKGLEREHAARLEELRDIKRQLEERFSTLASGVLKQNSEAFLQLVSERYKTHAKSAEADLDTRRAAIEQMVKPLSERLGQFDTQIRALEKARSTATGAIREQMLLLAQGQNLLGKETRRLVQALRAPKTRGRWGEMQLRQVFEMAGMTENVDFDLEHYMETDQGARRPDAIVHIPGGKSVVIDAKTPLAAYLDALESDTAEQREAHLLRHAAQVKEQVKLLSSKSYQSQFQDAPDFVVMFIPGEPFIAAAAEADPGLLEFAFAHKVLIASPTTLMALVKAIAYGWQQDKMARNAAEVQRVAQELYDRLRVFSDHMGKIGKGLNGAIRSYNSAVGSLESRVLSSARKFETMGVIPEGASLEGPEQVEMAPRLPASAPVQDDPGNGAGPDEIDSSEA